MLAQDIQKTSRENWRGFSLEGGRFKEVSKKSFQFLPRLRSGQVSELEKIRRAQLLRRLGNKLAKQYKRKFKGKELAVVVERKLVDDYIQVKRNIILIQYLIGSKFYLMNRQEKIQSEKLSR